jgi:hypothetical protein
VVLVVTVFTPATSTYLSFSSSFFSVFAYEHSPLGLVPLSSLPVHIQPPQKILQEGTPGFLLISAAGLMSDPSSHSMKGSICSGKLKRELWGSSIKELRVKH